MRKFRAHYTSNFSFVTEAETKHLPNTVEIMKNELGELVIEFYSQDSIPDPFLIEHYSCEQCYPID